MCCVIKEAVTPFLSHMYSLKLSSGIIYNMDDIKWFTDKMKAARNGIWKNI